MKKILLLMNPHSRSGEKAEQELVQAIKDHGHTIVNPLPLGAHADFNELIRKYRSEADLVMIGGGDGSMNAALEALVETKLPLLVFPQGTANNLARTYEIPKEIPKLLEWVELGRPIEVDLGSVNGIYFINVAGLGLSAEVNRNVSPSAKRYFGVFAFIDTAVRTFFQMRTFKAKIEVTEEGKPKAMEVRSWQISVCNGRYYGSGLLIEKDANLEDESLRLLSTEVKTGWQGVKLIPSLLSGVYKRGQEITLLRGDEIKISTGKKMRIDVDGDIKSETPALFKVHPKLLRLIVLPHPQQNSSSS